MTNDYQVSAEVLTKALASLRQALERYQFLSQQTIVTKDLKLIQDAVVKRFEYSHDDFRKYLKKILDQYFDRTELQYRKDLYREAYRFELIANPEHWMEYQELRNRTSHEYYEATAKKIPVIANQFILDAEDCLDRINQLEQTADGRKA